MYVQIQHIGIFLQFYKQDSGLELHEKSIRGMIMRAPNVCDNDDDNEGVSIGIVTHGHITLNDCC